MTTVPSTPPDRPATSETREPLTDARRDDIARLVDAAHLSLNGAAAFLQAGPGAVADLLAENARLRADAGEPIPVSPDDERAAYTTALRRLAGALDAWHDLPLPYTDSFNVPMTTNPAVETFAGARGLKVSYDGDGNASADLSFGAVTYHAYGYVDFDAQCEANAERNARRWADKHGLEIRPATPPAEEPAATPRTVTPDGLDAMVGACLRTDGRIDSLPVTVAALAELGYAVQDRGPYAWITDDGRRYVAEHQAREAGEAS